MSKSQLKTRQNKTIIITGASSGIGKAASAMLADQGCRILGVGLSRPPKNRHVSYFKADLGRLENIGALARAIIKKYRSIDWIVHSAGVLYPEESAYKPDRKIIENTFGVNVFAMIYLYYLLLDSLKEDGGFISVASTAGLHANEKVPIYSASKSAVISFGVALARHFAVSKKKLSSIILCPGPTNTPMRERFAHDAAKHQPPEFVAEIIAEIISGSSQYKNGDIIVAKNNKVELLSHLKF